MDLGLDGKVAVVLASTSGLGLASAQALLREGARVAISGRDSGRLAQARDRLAREAPGRVLADTLDVLDDRALAQHLEGVRSEWGTVHALVTNAGGPPPGGASTAGLEDLDRAYALTLRSAVVAVRTVLPWMRAQRHGRIVAMTSISVRQPIENLALSNALRAGLTGWLKTLAGEVGSEGIAVNSICTGLFATERLEALFQARSRTSGRSVDQERAAALAQIPLGRLGRPEEFGDLVAFLCSERCAYLHGVALPFDGGMAKALL
jgi:3-oxoacyl-[acyl-carrier protein] reductase